MTFTRNLNRFLRHQLLYLIAWDNARHTYNEQDEDCTIAINQLGYFLPFFFPPFYILLYISSGETDKKDLLGLFLRLRY